MAWLPPSPCSDSSVSQTPIQLLGLSAVRIKLLRAGEALGSCGPKERERKTENCDGVALGRRRQVSSSVMSPRTRRATK